MKLLRCYSQAPDLAILEGNMNETITVYLKVTLMETLLLSFTGIWQLTVTRGPNAACTPKGVARVLL